jgi:hypothetical protein
MANTERPIPLVHTSINPGALFARIGALFKRDSSPEIAPPIEEREEAWNAFFSLVQSQYPDASSLNGSVINFPLLAIYDDKDTKPYFCMHGDNVSICGVPPKGQTLHSYLLKLEEELIPRGIVEFGTARFPEALVKALEQQGYPIVRTDLDKAKLGEPRENRVHLYFQPIIGKSPNVDDYIHKRVKRLGVDLQNVLVGDLVQLEERLHDLQVYISPKDKQAFRVLIPGDSMNYLTGLLETVPARISVPFSGIDEIVIVREHRGTVGTINVKNQGLYAPKFALIGACEKYQPEPSVEEHSSARVPNSSRGRGLHRPGQREINIY